MHLEAPEVTKHMKGFYFTPGLQAELDISHAEVGEEPLCDVQRAGTLMQQ